MNKLCRIEIWFWKLIELEDIKVLRKLFLYSFYGYVYGFDWNYSVFFMLPSQKDCANWTLKCTRTNSVVTIFLLFSIITLLEISSTACTCHLFHNHWYAFNYTSMVVSETSHVTVKSYVWKFNDSRLLQNMITCLITNLPYRMTYCLLELVNSAVSH